MDLKRFYRILLLALGIISLVLGFAGIFLPLLPTTPFILLSAYCFARSSHRLHTYLLKHRIFGRILSDYSEKKIISKKTKFIALALLWPMLIVSIIFFMPFILVKFLVLLIGVGVTIYLLRFPSDNSGL